MAWHDSPAGSPGGCDELVAVKTNGTVNDNSDTDTGWCIELFIPNYELNADSMTAGYITSSKTVSYARVMAGVQNFYYTNLESNSPYDQAPEVAIPAVSTWEQPQTYITVNK
jgi:hypothetical protein